MKNPSILGTICGDTLGSVHEFENNKVYDFPIVPKMQPTDDSFMTIAVADWLMHDPELTHEGLAQRMRAIGCRHLYPMGGYGNYFIKWLQDDKMEAYGSYANGSAMRVSPVGYAFDSLDETLRVAKISAEITHNHPEGIKGAQATAAAVYMARMGATKEEIKTYVEKEFGYDLSRKYDDIRPDYKFEGGCPESVPESIIAFLESTSYEDAVRKVIAMGGDADTMGAITGAIAGAFYKEIPQEFVDQALKQMPDDLRPIVDEFEAEF